MRALFFIQSMLEQKALDYPPPTTTTLLVPSLLHERDISTLLPGYPFMIFSFVGPLKYVPLENHCFRSPTTCFYFGASLG